jgi:hypothetical protein
LAARATISGNNNPKPDTNAGPFFFDAYAGSSTDIGATFRVAAVAACSTISAPSSGSISAGRIAAGCRIIGRSGVYELDVAVSSKNTTEALSCIAVSSQAIAARAAAAS